jgi:hypothetical protein
LRALEQIFFSKPGAFERDRNNKAEKGITMTPQSRRYVRWFLLAQICWAMPVGHPALAQVQLPPNFISPSVPHDVPAGKAASVQDLAVFAWREFIALNWPSVDPATTGLRGTADTGADFVSVKKDADGSFPLLVWHTYQHKNELFPSDGKTNPSFDSKAPVYKYNYVNPIMAGANNPSFSLFNNLDETSQIGLCTMYAHNTIKIAYEAKVSRAIYEYANKTKLTACTPGSCPTLEKALQNTKGNLAMYGGICKTPSNAGPVVTLPCGDASIPGRAGEGSIEIKAAWRELTPQEVAGGRFFTRKVIFYTGQQFGQLQYQNAVWGLVALHIIHKTTSFPTFVFASWEQVDNYNDQTNQNTEDLRFHNITGTPLPPDIPVTRAHPIHSQVPPVNDAVHAAFKAKDPNTIWQYYKLIGVQGNPLTGPPPTGAPIDDLSYYYLANIVVETNQTLQNFFGGVNATTAKPQPFLNVYLNGAAGSPFQMGGCQGCHGTQGQSVGGDMSRLIAVAPSNSTGPPEPLDSEESAALKGFLLRSRDELRRVLK